MGQITLAPPLGFGSEREGCRWPVELGFYTWYEVVIFSNSRGKVGTTSRQSCGKIPQAGFPLSASPHSMRLLAKAAIESRPFKMASDFS